MKDGWYKRYKMKELVHIVGGKCVELVAFDTMDDDTFDDLCDGFIGLKVLKA